MITTQWKENPPKVGSKFRLSGRKYQVIECYRARNKWVVCAVETKKK